MNYVDGLRNRGAPDEGSSTNFRRRWGRVYVLADFPWRKISMSIFVKLPTICRFYLDGPPGRAVNNAFRQPLTRKENCTPRRSIVHHSAILMRNKYPSASPLPIPVLIAHKNPCVLDSLAPLLRSNIPGIALSLCHSHSYAIHSLTVARYQVVICEVQFRRSA